MEVYKAIDCVREELAKEGIAKGRKNQQQGWHFRGIDDVYGALAPLLAKHNLSILPRMLSREVTEHQTQKGGTLFYVVVDAEYDFVSSIDASKHTCKVFGEAMDSGDKATNKAMSMAYKYACFQAFSIPTEGDNDADATVHEVKARAAKPAAAKPVAPPTPDVVAKAQKRFEECSNLEDAKSTMMNIYNALAESTKHKYSLEKIEECVMQFKWLEGRFTKEEMKELQELADRLTGVTAQLEEALTV